MPFLRRLLLSWAASAVVLAVVALALVGAGCGEESAQTAKTNLCKSLDELAGSVVALQRLGAATTSKDDVKAAGQRVQDGWRQVKEDANDFEDATVRELERAGNDLTSSVANLPADATLADVVSTLGTQLSSFAAAFVKTVSTEGCNG